MAITYDPETRVIGLRTEKTSYLMQVDRLGALIHLYYGAPNPGFAQLPLTYVDRAFAPNPDAAGEDRTYSYDTLPQEYPTLGTGDFRHYALSIEDERGSRSCQLMYKSHQIHDGKYALPGLPAVWTTSPSAQWLEVQLEERLTGVEVTLMYGVLPENDIITRAAIVRNGGQQTVKVEKAAAATLDFISGDYDLLTFYGRHAMERQKQRAPIAHGLYSIGSRRGASSHQYNPAAIIARQQACESFGSCWGMMLMYSGNFLLEAEKDQINQTRVTLGLDRDYLSYPLAPGESLAIPEVVMSYSHDGFGALSNNFHACIRNNVCRGPYANAPRPVVLNSWEAAYFDFSADTILRLAADARDLGMDTVVMDDGWFGERVTDDSSLGDWQVNEAKLGMSLSELIAKVHALGVGFGIWIEPEMISERSRLYAEHPDWVIHVEGRAPIRGRGQLVLDFSRKEVRDNIFEQICEVLDQGPVDYVKWDMNRSLGDIPNGRLCYDYVLGVYDFAQRLLDRYPDMLIEGCTGGGGRFDAGMLYYTPQIWCSDNTDAICRTKIQYGTSFFYPMSTIASHVSAVPNHQTGRVTSMFTRGVTAMTGAFGYELDTTKLDDKDRERIREQIRFFKEHERLISQGEYFRLSDPFKDPVAAWQHVATDGSKTMLSAVRLSTYANAPRTYVRMRGLELDAWYEDEAGERYTGASLMGIGYPLPQSTTDYEGYRILFERCERE